MCFMMINFNTTSFTGLLDIFNMVYNLHVLLTILFTMIMFGDIGIASLMRTLLCLTLKEQLKER